MKDINYFDIHMSFFILFFIFFIKELCGEGRHMDVQVVLVYFQDDLCCVHDILFWKQACYASSFQPVSVHNIGSLPLSLKHAFVIYYTFLYIFLQEQHLAKFIYHKLGKGISSYL